MEDRDVYVKWMVAISITLLIFIDWCYVSGLGIGGIGLIKMIISGWGGDDFLPMLSRVMRWDVFKNQ